MINTHRVLYVLLTAMASLLSSNGYANDFISDDPSPQIFFLDSSVNDDGATDWTIRAEEDDDGGYFQIKDQIEAFNNTVFQINHSANNNNSFIVDSSGDINLADGTVFIDRSINRVGVGTSVPIADLHINTSNNVTEIRMENSESNWRWYNGTDGLWAGRISPTFANPFRIQNDSPDSSLVLDEAGVGIGTNLPSAKLDVRGDIKATFRGTSSSGLQQLFVMSANNSDTTQRSDAGFVMRNDREGFSWAFRTDEDNQGFSASKQATGAREFELRNATNVAANVELHLANGARNVNGQWLNASSRSFKENIHELSNEEAMQTLRSLKSVKYQFKRDDSNQQMVGFIAEDVPALLATQDRKTVDPLQIVAVLTKALQSQDEALQLQGKLFKAEMKTKDEKIAGMEDKLSTFELLKQRLDKIEANLKLP